MKRGVKKRAERKTGGLGVRRETTGERRREVKILLYKILEGF